MCWENLRDSHICRFSLLSQGREVNWHPILKPRPNGCNMLHATFWIMLQHVEQGWPNEFNIVQHGGKTPVIIMLHQQVASVWPGTGFVIIIILLLIILLIRYVCIWALRVYQLNDWLTDWLINCTKQYSFQLQIVLQYCEHSPVLHVHVQKYGRFLKLLYV